LITTHDHHIDDPVQGAAMRIPNGQIRAQIRRKSEGEAV